MLNSTDLDILDGCADHYELFYYLFAEVNYGGQVVRMSQEGSGRGFYPRIESQGTWRISVPGEEVARHARRLILARMLQCWRISGDPGDRGPFLTPEEQTAGLYRERVEITEPGEPEFAAYRGYYCVAFEEHMQRFGQGPHEFRITRSGIDEIQDPVYDELREA
jgi:hypothetical protein